MIRRALKLIAEHQITFAFGFAVGGIYCAAGTVAGQAFVGLVKAVAQ